MRKYLQLEGVGDGIGRIHMLKKIVKEADNIVTALHNIDASWVVSGIFPVARGGTGLSTIALGGILYASALDVLSRLAPTAANQVLRSTAANALQFAALVAADIPALDAAKITSGQFPLSRMPRAASGLFLEGNGVGADPIFNALIAANIPNLDAAKITSGVFALARIPNIDWTRISADFPRTIAALLSDHNLANHPLAIIPVMDWAHIAGLFPKTIADILSNHNLANHPLAIIPTMDDGHIPDLETLSYGGAFAVAQIPNLPASQITSGQFPLNRMPRAASGFLRGKGVGVNPAYEALVAGDIPNLDATKIVSGTFPVARGGTGLSTIALGGILYATALDTLSRLAPSAANQVLRSTAANALQFAALVAADIPNLPASKITSGVFDLARIPNIDWGRISANFPRTIADLLSDHDLAHHPLVIIPVMDWAHISGLFPRTIANLLSDHNLAHHGLGTIVPHDALASLTEKAHGSLTGIGASDHHVRYTDDEAAAVAAALIAIHAALVDIHHARSHDHSNALDGSPIAVTGVPNLDASKITSGTFPVARGGTGLSTIALGGILYASALDTLSRLAPTGANQVLRSTAANALQFAALLAADIPNLAASKITSGQFPLSRMPRAASGLFLEGNGAADPIYNALIAANIPSLDAAKITTGVLLLARIPNMDWAHISGLFPRTIAALLSDHDKAAHDALNIDADTVDGKQPGTAIGDIAYYNGLRKVYNSDRLDGYHETSFGRLAAARTWAATQTFSAATPIKTNKITERTAGVGVDIDNCLIKDGRAEDSNKLEGSTKAQVQDHTPKAHTLASHSTKAHTELTGVTSDQHHPQSHKDRHDPIDGADKLDTAIPVKVGAANAIGSSHSLARADHVHEREHAIYTHPSPPACRAATGAQTGHATAAQITKLNGIATGADVTGSNPPQAHKDSHDPIDGSDKLDTAIPVKVGAANAIGSSHSLARADHVHEREHAIYTHPTTGTCPQAPKAHNQDATTITSGRFPMTRMPDMGLNKVMVGQGAGNSPVEQDFAALSSKADTEYRVMDASSGDVSYTGYGFKPTVLIAFATVSATVKRNTGFSSSARVEKSVTTLDTNIAYASGFLIDLAEDTSTYQGATVKSYDVDGFTLTWTKYGTPATGMATIQILALK